MKTKHGEVPHIIPDPIKKKHEFLKEYKALCVKHSHIIDSVGYDGEIGVVKFNGVYDNDYDFYIDNIEV
jgi:hypothetical protein